MHIGLIQSDRKVCHELLFINKHETVSVADSFIPEREVCHELLFINKHETVSVADSFIPEREERKVKQQCLCVGGES